MGLTVGWAEQVWEPEPLLGTQGWQEGMGSPLYRLAFLEGALRLEPFPRVSL